MKIKVTQGHQKQIQRFNDLLKNKNFIDELEKVKKSTGDKQNRGAIRMAKKYLLEYERGSPFMDLLMGRKRKGGMLNNIDMCTINDDWDENLNPVFPVVPIKYDTSRKVRYENYPVSIGISPMASQRDVLDFIKKRWDLIRSYLDFYIENPKRIRIRPKEARNNFIWKNRNKKTSEIIRLLESKFSEESLGYQDIYKIISLEKKKRSEK